MKKLIFFGASMAIAVGLSAQQKRVCGTLEHEKFLEQQNPKRAQQREAYVKRMQEFAATQRQQNPNSTQSIIHIPLVVHLVYSSATDSISDAQIYSQIQILNDDYTRQNADAVNTPAPFQGVASAPMVQYCWAQQDPNGNPTNGIEKRKSTVTSWTTDDKVKSFATGGLNAWDPSRYFNIWVCNLGGGLLGYGEFPTGTVSSTYGFVAGYFCFGDTLKVNPPYDKGRTATHEIGHCFNLFHIWGDDQGACTGDDLCGDTPNQGSENYGCPAYPHTDACSPAAPGVMFMNYMDYTDDACMNMFTADQSARMTAVVNYPPYNTLKTSNTCSPMMANDAGVTAITQPTGNTCALSVTPQFSIRNWGSSALTAATINYQLDGGTPQTQAWSGNLPMLASATVSLGSVSVGVGSHTLAIWTSMPNGNTDAYPINDTSFQYFNVVLTGNALPLIEGFEGTAFPPAGWVLNNPDGATTWARANVGKASSHSAYMDNYNYQAAGQVDGLMAPAMDLTTAANPVLAFQVAYRLYTSPTATLTFSDTLEVTASNDCGTTSTSIYKKWSTNLTTATPPFSTSSFTPSSTQWRLEVVSLAAWKTFPQVFIQFNNINDYENQLYIDNVNICDSLAVGVQLHTLSEGYLVYPNPSASGVFFVDIKNPDAKLERLSVYDMLGNKVYGIEQKIPAGFYEMDLKNLANGSYMLEVVTDNKSVFSKIVISK